MHVSTSRRLRVVLALALSLGLTACGGGGGGSSAPAVPATPPPPPPPTVANTSAAQYLPESTGNAWTFTNGAAIRDLGPGALTCTCAINGVALEKFGLYTPQATLSGIFYYAKGIYPNGVLSGRAITYLTGVSNDGGTTIVLAGYTFDGSIPGLGSIDDNPTAGETFTFIPGQAYQPSAVSTITSIGGTQSYGTNQIITSIAQDTIQSGTVSFGFGYARGVGFVNVSLQSQSLAIASFTVNASTAHAAARHSDDARPVFAREAVSETERNAPATIARGLFGD